MIISSADLIALDQQLINDEKRLEQELAMVKEKRRAVELIKAHIAEHPKLDLVEQEQPQQTATSLKQPKVSFAEAVRQAVRQFKDEEFTVANVENVLRAQGVALPPNHTRTRIAIEVKDLVRKGLIRLVTRGSGNTPHQYRMSLLSSDAPKSERVSALTLTPAVQH